MLTPERQSWNNFVDRAPGGSFLQSWEWGEVQEVFGAPIWRLAVGPLSGPKTALSAVALVLRRELPSGQNWLYVPRGPIVNTSPQPSPSKGEGVQSQLVALAKDQHSLFIRTEPAKAPAEKDWKKADHDVQPRHSIIVDLDGSENELLKKMHTKTRYNIRLAERRGVTVRFSNEAKDLELFLKLSREVTGRGEFRFHPDEYYRALHHVGCRAGNDMKLEIAVAENDGDVLAVHLLISFGGTMTYAHGASSSNRRNLMAPHLLQWESIKRAKQAGLNHYDLFGVAPQSSAEGGTAGHAHPWAGITRFKEGFGGRRVSYPGACDMVQNHVGYWLYSAARKLRR